MNKIDLIILSKSYKDSGFCVVGINMSNWQLIRIIPLDMTSYRSVDKRSLNCLKNGTLSQADILDLIRIEAFNQQAVNIQKENIYVYDKYVEYLGKCDEHIIKKNIQ